MIERIVSEAFLEARAAREQHLAYLGRRIKKLLATQRTASEIAECLGLTKTKVLSFTNPRGPYHHLLVD